MQDPQLETVRDYVYRYDNPSQKRSVKYERRPPEELAQEVCVCAARFVLLSQQSGAGDDKQGAKSGLESARNGVKKRVEAMWKQLQANPDDMLSETLRTFQDMWDNRLYYKACLTIGKYCDQSVVLSYRPMQGSMPPALLTSSAMLPNPISSSFSAYPATGGSGMGSPSGGSANSVGVASTGVSSGTSAMSLQQQVNQQVQAQVQAHLQAQQQAQRQAQQQQQQHAEQQRQQAEQQRQQQQQQQQQQHVQQRPVLGGGGGGAADGGFLGGMTMEQMMNSTTSVDTPQLAVVMGRTGSHSSEDVHVPARLPSTLTNTAESLASFMRFTTDQSRYRAGEYYCIIYMTDDVLGRICDALVDEAEALLLCDRPSKYLKFESLDVNPEGRTLYDTKFKNMIVLDPDRFANSVDTLHNVLRSVHNATMLLDDTVLPDAFVIEVVEVLSARTVTDKSTSESMPSEEDLDRLSVAERRRLGYKIFRPAKFCAHFGFTIPTGVGDVSNVTKSVLEVVSQHDYTLDSWGVFQSTLGARKWRSTLYLTQVNPDVVDRMQSAIQSVVDAHWSNVRVHASVEHIICGWCSPMREVQQHWSVIDQQVLRERELADWQEVWTESQRDAHREFFCTSPRLLSRGRFRNALHANVRQNVRVTYFLRRESDLLLLQSVLRDLSPRVPNITGFVSCYLIPEQYAPAVRLFETEYYLAFGVGGYQLIPGPDNSYCKVSVADYKALIKVIELARSHFKPCVIRPDIESRHDAVFCVTSSTRLRRMVRSAGQHEYAMERRQVDSAVCTAVNQSNGYIAQILEWGHVCILPSTKHAIACSESLFHYGINVVLDKGPILSPQASYDSMSALCLLRAVAVLDQPLVSPIVISDRFMSAVRDDEGAHHYDRLMRRLVDMDPERKVATHMHWYYWSVAAVPMVGRKRPREVIEQSVVPSAPAALATASSAAPVRSGPVQLAHTAVPSDPSYAAAKSSAGGGSSGGVSSSAPSPAISANGSKGIGS